MGIINGASTTDPNKILPMKYPWARTHYKKGVANNWVPEEVSMQQDVELWKKAGGLSEDEAPHDHVEPRLFLNRRVAHR